MAELFEEGVVVHRVGIEGAIPDFRELFESQLATKLFGDMQVPVSWRNTAFLPVEPAGIVLEGRPDFLRRESGAVREARCSAGDVHANQDAADIEDDGAEFQGWHGLFTLDTGNRSGAPLFEDLELVPRAKDADDGGHQGKHDDNGDDVMDALADVGNRAAQGVTAENHGADPENSSKNVEGKIARIRHLRRAGDRGTERSNDGNEARENDGAAAIFFIEIMSALKVAAAEEKRVLAAVECSARGAADPVADLIAHNGAEHDGEEQPFERDHAGGGKNAGGDEQGVTGQEEADKETGFDEDNRADERGAAGAD